MTDAPSAELLERFRQHDEAAARELFRRYADRLTRLARARLSSALAARVDAEDVVQSAYRSFFELAREGGVSLSESGDLWRLLARITLRKVSRNARRHRAGCRSVERESPWPDETGEPSHEPTPADEAALADELRCLLAPLDPVRRRIVELRLLGHEAAEIAPLVGRTDRTVRRVLAWLGEELHRRLSEPVLPDDSMVSLDYGEVVLRRQIGQGGMGKVYRASWRGECVAVKLLPRPLRGHARIAARFLDESALLGRLRHRHIVSVRGVGRLPDGGHFLVMDFVEGGDLSQRLQAGPVSLTDALRWTAQAADAIEYAHGQGVIHCDLKPSNLLLDGDDARVSDFGLARTLAGEEPVGGTRGYLAPEQLDPKGSVTPRTDVHGLGVVLYSLLTGRAPFPVDQGAASVPSPLGVDVPAAIAELLSQCLCHEPLQRPASAGDLARRLRAQCDL